VRSAAPAPPGGGASGFINVTPDPDGARKDAELRYRDRVHPARHCRGPPRQRRRPDPTRGPTVTGVTVGGHTVGAMRAGEYRDPTNSRRP
jgi:hypothetical protein